MLTARTEVPFVTQAGRRGVIRGYHGGKRAVLLTWAGGSKADMSPYERVFAPEAISEEEIEELRRLHEQAEQIKERRKEIEAKATSASDLLAEQLGEDLTDHPSVRERKRQEQQEANA